MASPWVMPTPQGSRPDERSWMGLAMLLSIPLLSLVLIRMLWSGSTLWFLMIGLVLLGTSAVLLLSRRGNGYEQRTSLAAGRAPLILGGLGALLLALLVVPNFSSSSTPAALTTEQRGPSTNQSEVSGIQQTPRATAGSATPRAPTATAQAQPTRAQPTPTAGTESQPPASAATGGETYTVQDGDTLWDIAEKYDTTVDAIVAANHLTDENDLHIGQELTIPASQ